MCNKAHLCVPPLHLTPTPALLLFIAMETQLRLQGCSSDEGKRQTEKGREELWTGVKDKWYVDLKILALYIILYLKSTYSLSGSFLQSVCSLFSLCIQVISYLTVCLFPFSTPHRHTDIVSPLRPSVVSVNIPHQEWSTFKWSHNIITRPCHSNLICY